MDELAEIIRDEIRAKGPMRFKKFMNLALYHPEMGYYTSQVKIGDENDFTTMPERHSPYYGQAFARLIVNLTKSLPEDEIFQIVEQGAGNGTLARDILEHLRAEFPRLYERTVYSIVEISPRLGEKQRENLKSHDNVSIREGDAKEFNEREFDGVILSNELPDTFPVDLAYKFRKAVYLMAVEYHQKEHRFVSSPPSPGFNSADEETLLYLEEGTYLSMMRNCSSCSLSLYDITKHGVPVNLNMIHWYGSLAGGLRRGAILTTDYGFQNSVHFCEALYQFGRTTVRTYPRNGVVPDNPLTRVGELDITTDINFELLIKCGVVHGLVNVCLTEDKEIVKRYARREMESQFLTLIQQKGLSKPRI